jgi:hypothetical protein
MTTSKKKTTKAKIVTVFIYCTSLCNDFSFKKSGNSRWRPCIQLLTLLACLHQSPRPFHPDDTKSLLIPSQRPVIVRAPSSLVRRSCRHQAEHWVRQRWTNVQVRKAKRKELWECGGGKQGDWRSVGNALETFSKQEVCPGVDEGK